MHLLRACAVNALCKYGLNGSDQFSNLRLITVAKKKRVSGEFIFTENNDRELEFVGDFEGLYRDFKNPWSQSANGTSDPDWTNYYDVSRTKIGKKINSYGESHNVLEIGCGLGFALDLFAKNAKNSTFFGMDISHIAIQKAGKSFPNYSFFQGDITSKNMNFKKKYNIVIFSQVLWYILENLDLAMSNAHKLIKTDGYLLISQAFLREQRYGKNIIDGYSGTLEYLRERQQNKFLVVSAQSDPYEKLSLDDGLIVSKKV